MTGDGDCCRNETKGKVCDHETTVTDAKDARRESNRRAFVRSRTSTGVKHTTTQTHLVGISTDVNSLPVSETDRDSGVAQCVCDGGSETNELHDVNWNRRHSTGNLEKTAMDTNLS
ncbi:hypothetical protein F2P79_023812 [Pimephales promelas]|nr:hypothetical protein F2P79_023812 [Pimephales promelas]